ncbi:hypothetical protein R9X49_21910 [Pectobacterium carotovorum]|uniref:hypothetical protein n=1 Tax=Pectobacterium carotovorum TaxID=554 RepID=UPI0029D56233|nr:hypothetical protein [Pectobacterium carotovorum]MDX6917754.1 hypothetical protein [Pectobacterium carotovorum]
MMYGSVGEIASELEKEFGTDEKFTVVVFSADGIRMYGQDYNPSNTDIEKILQQIAEIGRECNTNIRDHTIVELLDEQWAEKQRNRSVGIPVKYLEVVMKVASQEMDRLALYAADAGENVAEFLAEEISALKSIREAIEAKTE